MRLPPTTFPKQKSQEVVEAEEIIAMFTNSSIRPLTREQVLGALAERSDTALRVIECWLEDLNRIPTPGICKGLLSCLRQWKHRPDLILPFVKKLPSNVPRYVPARFVPAPKTTRTKIMNEAEYQRLLEEARASGQIK